jgi:hypothetical protein
MGAHALGAAAYAAEATGLAAANPHEAVAEEIRWQLDHMSPATRAALRQLPPLGESRSGPLGPGLLTTGLRAEVVRQIQDSLKQDGTGPPGRGTAEKHQKAPE